MSNEISNKTLAILMITAIVLSIGGTFFSLNRLAYLVNVKQPNTQAYITNPTGVAKVNITGISSLRFSIATLDFGTGYVNTSGGNYCSMASGSPSGYKDTSDRCVNFNSPASLVSLQLENDGNTNLTLVIASDKNASTFLGGTAPGFMYEVTNNESNSCTTPTPSTWTNMPIVDTSICGSPGLGFIDNSDSLNIHLNITIPYNSLIGQQTATLLITGTSG
jgi:hypothetical protein